MSDEPDYFKSAYLDEFEDLVFYVSDGDCSRVAAMMEEDVELIFKFYFRKRMDKLNELISSVTQLEKSK